jgi:hypothetical protein
MDLSHLEPGSDWHLPQVRRPSADAFRKLEVDRSRGDSIHRCADGVVARPIADDPSQSPQFAAAPRRNPRLFRTRSPSRATSQSELAPEEALPALPFDEPAPGGYPQRCHGFSFRSPCAPLLSPASSLFLMTERDTAEHVPIVRAIRPPVQLRPPSQNRTTTPQVVAVVAYSKRASIPGASKRRVHVGIVAPIRVAETAADQIARGAPVRHPL